MAKIQWSMHAEQRTRERFPTLSVKDVAHALDRGKGRVISRNSVGTEYGCFVEGEAVRALVSSKLVLVSVWKPSLSKGKKPRRDKRSFKQNRYQKILEEMK